MALNSKQKDRLRHVIRVTMVTIAVLLLFFAVVVPIINNAIALGIEGDLKSLPLPLHTEVIESTSVAGRLVGNGNGMQYFGAILLKSDLTLEQLQQHYRAYRTASLPCTLERQKTSAVHPAGNSLQGVSDLSFRTDVMGENYYILYSWGSAPTWLRDLLNSDMRGH